MTPDRLLLPVAALAIPALLLVACAVDSDNDGVPDSQDCQPENPEIFPGQEEDPTNGIDDDCDFDVDERDDGDDDDAVRVDPGDLDVSETVTGNFECVGGQLDPPQPGVTGELTIFVEDFQDDVAVPEAHVELWPTNDPSGGDFSFEGTSDLNGELVVPEGQIQACSLFAARNFTRFDPPETYQTYQINLVVSGEPPWRSTITSVSYATYQLVSLSLGVEAENGKGIAAGRFKDCDGEPIGNAETEVGRLDTATGEFTAAPGYSTRYFNEDEDPDIDQNHLAVGAGLYGALNVPPEATPWDVIAWGLPQDESHCITTDDGANIIRPDGFDQYCLLGKTNITVLPNSVNVSNLELKLFPDVCYEEEKKPIGR
jgi:hypothetical protein